MTAPKSTVPAVRAWLTGQFTTVCAGIVGDPVTRAVQVFTCVQNRDTDDDLVIVGTTSRSQITPLVMMGGFPPGSLSEEAQITCQIVVFGTGPDTPADVADRAWSVQQQLAAVVWADPTLGGHAIRAALGDIEDQSAEDEDDNLVCQLSFTVTYTAQI